MSIQGTFLLKIHIFKEQQLQVLNSAFFMLLWTFLELHVAFSKFSVCHF